MRIRPTPHDVLTPFQRHLLRAIFALPVARESFALGGGTGLAEFYAGHRRSADFDLFSDDGVALDDLATRIPATVSSAGATVESLRTHAAFHRFITRGPDGAMTLIDVLRADPPRLGEVRAVDGVNVLSLDDIAVGKMLAVHDRVEIKDGIDLWALSDLGCPLPWLRQRALDKDRGLAGAPMSVVGNLLDMARSDLPWPEMVTSLDHETLRSFLLDAADQLAADIAASIPGEAKP